MTGKILAIVYRCTNCGNTKVELTEGYQSTIPIIEHDCNECAFRMASTRIIKGTTFQEV